MSLYINKRAQKLWNSLCEFYDREEREAIRSDIEIMVERTALEQGVPLVEDDQEYIDLNKKISNRYIELTHAMAVYYLNKFPKEKEIPVVFFTYEELFQEEPAEEEPGQGPD